jgi:hypothetical protein
VWHATTKPIPPPLCAPDGDMVYKGKNFHFTMNLFGDSSRPLWAMVKRSSPYSNFINIKACGKPPPYRSC